MKFSGYEEFWPYYLSQHSRKGTRIWHFIGTSTVFLWIILAAALQNGWLVLPAPVTAYGMAWIGHFFVERNKPATFGYPLWSLRADFRMYGLMLTGRLDAELERHGIKEKAE